MFCDGLECFTLAFESPPQNALQDKVQTLLRKLCAVYRAILILDPQPKKKEEPVLIDSSIHSADTNTTRYLSLTSFYCSRIEIYMFLSLLAANKTTHNLSN